MTKEFKRVLIANRGEIALRVVRACRDATLPFLRAVLAEPAFTAEGPRRLRRPHQTA